uniref:Uncharacterized protein n=1 Tax=viral metagenome TaxID=1070528 RepID=A0A6C0D2J9_9ZZZZ
MQILLIEKDGNIIEKNVKSLEKMYSLCGYRTNKDFEQLCQWDTYELYGKRTGKKDKENQYKFSTNDKYYGTLCIIKKNDSISLDEWKLFYISKMKDSIVETAIATDSDTYEIESNTETDDADDNVDNHDTHYLGKRVDEELKYEEYEEE